MIKLTFKAYNWVDDEITITVYENGNIKYYDDKFIVKYKKELIEWDDMENEEFESVKVYYENEQDYPICSGFKLDNEWIISDEGKCLSRSNKDMNIAIGQVLANLL